MLLKKQFTVLKPLDNIVVHVGESYAEYFIAYEKNKELFFYIVDDNFGYPSPSNFMNTPYAKRLRDKCEKILQDLLDEGYIKIKE